MRIGAILLWTRSQAQTLSGVRFNSGYSLANWVATEIAGVEDALGYCFGAAIIAAMLFWVLSS